MRVETGHVEKALFRSDHPRSAGRIESSFANKSFFDGLAFVAKVDPAEFRLHQRKDARGAALIHRAMPRARWTARAGTHNLIDRPDPPTCAADEPTPGALPAVIGNAVVDATGAQLRDVLFTAGPVKAAMQRA